MTLTLEIPSDVEAGLLAAADAKGVSPEAYATQVLRERLQSVPQESKRPAGRKSLPQLFAESPLKGLDLNVERDPDTGRSLEL